MRVLSDNRYREIPGSPRAVSLTAPWSRVSSGDHAMGVRIEAPRTIRPEPSALTTPTPESPRVNAIRFASGDQGS